MYAIISHPEQPKRATVFRVDDAAHAERVEDVTPEPLAVFRVEIEEDARRLPGLVLLALYNRAAKANVARFATRQAGARRLFPLLGSLAKSTATGLTFVPDADEPDGPGVVTGVGADEIDHLEDVTEAPLEKERCGTHIKRLVMTGRYTAKQIEAAAASCFPRRKVKPGYAAWYRWDLKRRGEDPPEFAS